jgi:CheY-like chemotaxis protein
MFRLLLVDDDAETLRSFAGLLRCAGYSVRTAACAKEALRLLREDSSDLVLSDLCLPDMSGVDLLKQLRAAGHTIPFVLVTGFANTRDTVETMRHGAVDVLEKPVLEEHLLLTLHKALSPRPDDQRAAAADSRPLLESHAAGRWARAIVAVLDSPTDPRTFTLWSRLTAAAPGTLKNWCRTAGVPPRHSLVFARLLRAAHRLEQGPHKLENLLDLSDRRTLTGLLRLAGVPDAPYFPADIYQFVRMQTLVRDPEALQEVCRAIARRSLFTSDAG